MSLTGKEWRTVNWSDLIPRLLLVAKGRLNRQRHLSNATRMREAEDYVQDAISKTISRVRPYRGSVSLYKHLAWAIVSEIHNDSNKLEHRLTDCLDQDGSSSENKNVVIFPDPEQELSYKTELDNLLNYLEGIDIKLRVLAELMLIYKETGSVQVATYMEISPKEVYNLKKRLTRYVKSYQQSTAM